MQEDEMIQTDLPTDEMLIPAQGGGSGTESDSGTVLNKQSEVGLTD